ncbi:MAG: glucosyl-3-phosphoglycerate synthase [Acidimicrobiales bacterium]
MTVRVFDRPSLEPAALAAAKGALTVSLCLPARNEALTLAAILDVVVGELMTPAAAVVDELLVLDDGSTDATARVAATHGARVVAVDDVLTALGPGRGKGNVLWRSLAASRGDLIVWCDADVTSFSAHYVTSLLTPLIGDPTVGFVKGFYERPTVGDPITGADGHGGGRVTELVARPLLSRFFPDLAGLRQPLSGEMAGRRSVLEAVPFVQGYGVETGLVIDVAQRFGIDRMVQVDLGVRRHRHQGLAALAVQATEILQVVLDRAGVRDRPDFTGTDGSGAALGGVDLRRADGSTVTVPLRQWPPMAEIRAGVQA